MSRPVTGKPQLNRVVNRTLILDRIRLDGAVSRAELAKITAIRPPTVSAVIAELIRDGLVEEVGNGESSGGRAPRMVSLRKNQPRAIGFEVCETALLAGICDMAGNLRAQTRVEFSPTTPERTVDRLYAVGEELLGGLGLSWSALRGVGVAVPGHLDNANGIVRWSHPFNWRQVPLRSMCESRWGTPTDVVNDSAAGSMAAHFLGPGRELKNLVYLYVRLADASHGVVGLGSGIIVNGEPYHGEFGAAGEITTPVAHPLTYARDAQGRPFGDLAAFVAAVTAGDSAASAAIARLAREMSQLVVHAVNFLEPGMLVIGSDMAELREALLERLQGILDEHSLQHEAGRTKVVASTLGEFGVVRGAVVPTLQRVFRMPRWS
jgi:N-acetylglucosamine repressor